MQDDLLFVYRALEAYLGTNEGSTNGSNSDLAGFSDPIISMPPITSALLTNNIAQTTPCYPATAPILISPNNHQTALSPVGGQPTMQLDLVPTQQQCQNATIVAAVVPPQQQNPQTIPANPPNGCVPVDGHVPHQQPTSPPASVTPANGYATLTGNGNIRVPPDGMEDAPQATDIPPV